MDLKTMTLDEFDAMILIPSMERLALEMRAAGYRMPSEAIRDLNEHDAKRREAKP